VKRTIAHFEIPANDVQKLSGFYQGLFGWKLEKTPGMDYWLIKTGEGEEELGGGMMPRMDPSQGIVDYFDVESVDKASEKLIALGGQVLMGKQAVPQMGWFAVCRDPEGNAFGLWQDDPAAA